MPWERGGRQRWQRRVGAANWTCPNAEGKRVAAGKWTGGRSSERKSMEDRNRSYPRTIAIGMPFRPRRLGPTSSWPGPQASTRPEAKQVSRGDPAECSHINRLPRKAARGRSGWRPRIRSGSPIACQAGEPELRPGDPAGRFPLKGDGAAASSGVFLEGRRAPALGNRETRYQALRARSRIGGRSPRRLSERP